MDSNNWQKFKSGTDIRFTAVTTQTAQADLGVAEIRTIVGAFALWLMRKTGKTDLRVAVGHDCRISADWISETAILSLTDAGCFVMDAGLCSTPNMFWMTQFDETNADGSVMVTASHHPFDKNGLKLFTKDGGLESAEISEILSLAAAGQKHVGCTGTVERKDYMALYVESLKQRICQRTGEELPLKGLKLVVDAGNGAGGFFADRVLKPLGADTEGSQFLEPDGRFPNHIPNPENKEAMAAISRCVIKNKADLGIIFDTDVDRAAVVSADGKEINRNRLIALIARIVLGETPGATIVTDSVTSDGLATFIRQYGGTHRRFKRGYKNVIDEAIRLEKEGVSAPLAIETSGHAALKENKYLDDGAYLVVKLLIAMVQLKKEGRKLTDLICDLSEPTEEAEIRLTYTVENWKEVGPTVLSKVETFARNQAGWRVADDSCEGVRVSTPDGFFLMRMSVHDPVIPVNFEANYQGGVLRLVRDLLKIVEDVTQLDLTKLKQAADAE